MPLAKEFLVGTSLDFSQEIDRAENFRLRVMHYEHLHDEWVIGRAKDLANKIVVDDIRKQMIDAGFSEKIWKNSFLSARISFDKRKGKITLYVRSMYKTETGFDVAIAREHGTRRHWIAPRIKMALSWITLGIRLFSKGHYVSGIKSLFIIRDTVKKKEKEFQKQFKIEYFLWKQAILPEVMNPERAS